MSIFNKISLSICLVLDHRIQEWFRIRSEFQELGFNVIPFICGDGKTLDYEVYSYIDRIEKPPLFDASTSYPTWWKEPYRAYQAWKCHREIFNLFINSSCQGEYLLLLEDDVQIEPNFHEVLINIEDDINELKPDALYLGSYNRDGTWSSTNNPNLMTMHGCAGFHAIVLSYDLCKDLVQFLPLGPYDETFGKFHRNYKVYGVYPSIITQKSGFSFIENSQLNKPSAYER